MHAAEILNAYYLERTPGDDGGSLEDFSPEIPVDDGQCARCHGARVVPPPDFSTQFVPCPECSDDPA